MKAQLIVFYLLLFFYKANCQTLHSVIITDQLDMKIGATCMASETKMDNQFHKIADKIDYAYKPNLLAYDKFNSQSLIKTIQSLNVAEGDILITYYAGKSFFRKKRKSEFPNFLFAPKNYISMTEIGNKMEKKNAHLSLLILDSQNTIFDINIPDGPKPIDLVGISADLSKIIAKKIFLGTCGLFKIASGINKKTIPLKLYAGQPLNSHFSEQFAKVLDNYFSDNTMERIYSFTIDNVMEDVERNIKSGSKQPINEPILVLKHENCTAQALTTAGKINQYKYPENIPALESRIREIIKITDDKKQDYLIGKLNECIHDFANFSTTIDTPEGKNILNLNNISFLNYVKENAKKIKTFDFNNKNQAFRLPINDPAIPEQVDLQFTIKFLP